MIDENSFWAFELIAAGVIFPIARLVHAAPLACESSGTDADVLLQMRSES